MIAGYIVTADDWLWLLRAVQAEGPSSDDVARALVNLWAFARSRGSKQSIAELVRNYSQPVNPKWAHGGAFDVDPEVVSLEERRRLRARTAETFSPAVALAVSRALTSSHSSDVTDFAAPGVDASRKGYRPRGPAIRGRNRTWTRSPGWQGYKVAQMRNSERVAAIRSMARALPESEREHIEAQLLTVLSRYTNVSGMGDALLDGVKVIRPGDPGYDAARAAAAEPVESDLALANWLDGVSTAVSDRVKELGGSALNAVEKVASPVSTLLWALAAFQLIRWLSKE